MRRDIDILRDIVEYCDVVYEAVEMFGSDMEGFMDNKVYQTSTDILDIVCESADCLHDLL